MEQVIYKKIRSIEKALEKLEMIKGVIYDSSIEERDKKAFSDILNRAYAKRDDLKKSYESSEKGKHKRIKFQPHHF